MKTKQEKRISRHKRIRAKISGTAEVPRLSVFRSNKHIYAQLINDQKGHTILSANDLELKKSERPHHPFAKAKPNKKKKSKETKKPLSGKVALAYQVGKLIAKKAKKQGIKKVVFDRGGYKYHGRVKALAEGAREAGLEF